MGARRDNPELCAPAADSHIQAISGLCYILASKDLIAGTKGLIPGNEAMIPSRKDLDPGSEDLDPGSKVPGLALGATEGGKSFLAHPGRLDT